MRLGCAGKVLGKPGLKSYDARRRDHDPHLTVSLAYVRDILRHLDQLDIRFYRMSSKLAPSDTTDTHRALFEVGNCEEELAFVGELARSTHTRLSMHAPLHVVLTAEDDDMAARGAYQLYTLACILDAMGTGPEAIIVLHAGGTYHDKRAAMHRFSSRCQRLPDSVRRRIALENDGSRYSLPDVCELSKLCGLPVVFDRLHFLLNNPEGLLITEALRMALETWTPNITPILHFSSPRTDANYLTSGRGAAAQHSARPPLWSQHSDYVNPFEFIDFAETACGVGSFDVMLEAKAKDLAVTRLREDLKRFAPRLAVLFSGETTEDSLAPVSPTSSL
jgi:UV DNA damage endonuclease